MTNIDSPDEDIGNLRQMKEFASDLYDKRINARGGNESGDRFAQEVGNIIHHVDKAIDERLAEKNRVAHVSGEGYMQVNPFAAYGTSVFAKVVYES